MTKRGKKWVQAMALMVALGAGAMHIGCSSGPEIEEMDYADQAEYLFEEGMAQLERGRYIRAVDSFNTVRNEYPHSRWAAMANLRIGDAYFEQGQLASAVQQYRGFVNLYPRHEKVEYARWQIANSFYEQMPSGFFLLPAPHERDLSTTRDAVRELELFLDRYGDSEYAEEAQEKWREGMTRLARHEYEIGKYYFDRDNPQATVQRLRYLLSNYSGLGLDAEALYLLGLAHRELGDEDRARSVWGDLVEHHDHHPRAAEAARELSR